ncbi:MAG: acyl-CoA dehydrogenase family protein [Desulfobacterales bacterium]
MDYRLTPEQEAFRKEFSEWLDQNLPEGFDPSKRRNYKTSEEHLAAYKEFQNRLYKGGYTAMHYSEEYGGQGKTLMEESIVLRTIAEKCMELRGPGVITFGMAVPTIHTCGSEEQKRKYLPKIMDGTHLWCQGFSEPEAGSDVANVSTMAIRKGDHYVVNGQKVWTSMAHMADYCILLVRTDPEAVKHRGLSYLLMDMKTPGVDVRPMKQMTGEADFNEIFMDNVNVPVENLVGKEGDGWMIAITTLMFERALGDVTMAAIYEKTISNMLAMAKTAKRSGKPAIEDPLFRQKLARHYIEVMVLKYHGLRNFSKTMKAGVPGPESSIGKLLWSEPNQGITDDALNIEGPVGQITENSPWSINDGAWQYAFLRSKGNTIEAGSSEILRNIIGERVLGLPKDASRAVVRK